MAIAAARLGLHCASLGHVGDEIYGHFLLDVLREEGIDFVDMNENIESICRESISYQTLLCWVLVDPFQKHGFCRYASSGCCLNFQLLAILSTCQSFISSLEVLS